MKWKDDILPYLMGIYLIPAGIVWYKGMTWLADFHAWWVVPSLIALLFGLIAPWVWYVTDLGWEPDLSISDEELLAITICTM